MTYGRTTTLTRDVRTWRADAVTRAIRILLLESGCRFTIDDIARRVGVPKGSLFVDRAVVVEIIEQTLDTWAEHVAPPTSGDDVEPFTAACRSLLSTQLDADGVRRAAIPCCLVTSPCPHGWHARWGSIAVTFGLGTSEIAMMLGEALQAIAASDRTRALLAEGRTADAVEHVLGYLDSD